MRGGRETDVLRFATIPTAMLSLLLPLPAVAAARGGAARAGGDEPRVSRLTTAETSERIPLPRMRGPVELSVDAYARRIRLRAPAAKDGPALAARLASHAGALCPKVAVRDGGVELTCRSRRIDAQIAVERGAEFLDIDELRGLPWRAGNDGPPSFHYDPWSIGFGQGCPGRSEGARGECQLKEGQLLAAAGSFRAALDTPSRPLASVRLGDLALATGDPTTAAGWYRRAGTFGVFGRVALARLCELDGHCLGDTKSVLEMFDTEGMPEPLRAEMAVRAARAEAYEGRTESALRLIARQVRAHGGASICREGGDIVCRRIVLDAMTGAGAAGVKRTASATASASASASATAENETAEGGEGGEEYLEDLFEAYLGITGWEKGPLAVEMAQAAAPLAARLGAPQFGGNILAAVAPVVPRAMLADHLLLTAETFLAGLQWARARVIAEYADTRLGKAALASPRWAAVQRALAGRADEDDLAPPVRAALEAELKATAADLKTARAAMAKAKGMLGGARASAEPGAARRTERP